MHSLHCYGSFNSYALFSYGSNTYLHILFTITTNPLMSVI